MIRRVVINRTSKIIQLSNRNPQIFLIRGTPGFPRTTPTEAKIKRAQARECDVSSAPRKDSTFLLFPRGTARGALHLLRGEREMREDRHLGGGICSEQASRNHHLLPRRRTAPSRVVGARKGRAAREARGAFVGRPSERRGG